jgi:hypothetical protein
MSPKHYYIACFAEGAVDKISTAPKFIYQPLRNSQILWMQTAVSARVASTSGLSFVALSVTMMFFIARKLTGFIAQSEMSEASS